MILHDDVKRRSIKDDYYCPSAEEIRQACLAIQATWTEAERLRRRGQWWKAESDTEPRGDQHDSHATSFDGFRQIQRSP